MKKYKSRVPLVKPFKIVIAVLFATIVTSVIFIFNGANNVVFIICLGVLVVLLYMYCINVISVSRRYSYCGDYVNISRFCLPNKRIYYHDFECIIISNAAYNNGYGYGPNIAYPMQYKIKCKYKIQNVTYPFISFHSKQYPIEKVTSKSTSRELYFLDENDMACIGICWSESFAELLVRPVATLYILEDVYLRFRKAFDCAIESNPSSARRCFIIADHKISYFKYKEMLSISKAPAIPNSYLLPASVKR